MSLHSTVHLVSLTSHLSSCDIYIRWLLKKCKIKVLLYTAIYVQETCKNICRFLWKVLFFLDFNKNWWNTKYSSWMRNHSTSQKVVGLICDKGTAFFPIHLIFPASLRHWSTRNLCGVKSSQYVRLNVPPLSLNQPSRKYASLNVSQSQLTTDNLGPLTGTALPSVNKRWNTSTNFGDIF
jgi:hypothetical protein